MISRKINEARKEKLFIIYSKSLFFSSLKIILICLFLLCFAMLIDLIYVKFFSLIFSVEGFLNLSLIFLIYNLIRKKIYAKL